MTDNFWTAHAAALAEAYVRAAGGIRFELVTRALLLHLPAGPQRIVDVGGGYGMQAIRLARAGHSVVVVDIDPKMLAIARDKLSHEPPEVSSRVELVLGLGEEAASLVGTGFDLACCHSVLMYQAEWAPMLSHLVDLVHRGGLLSVLSINKESYAMRSGLQGRWQEAVAILEGRPFDSQDLPISLQSREEVVAVLAAAGAKVLTWQGLGVFTDHLVQKLDSESAKVACEAEWLAGNRDPYRQVARCFHIIAERWRSS